MKYVREIWFVDCLDWYTIEEGVGYVPTELALPEAVESMKRLNEMSEEDIA